MKLDDVLFFFMRHGETAGNKDNVYRGWSNAQEAQLDESGKRAAREAGRYLATIGAPVELMVGDSLDRVQESIELAAESFPNVRVEFVRALHPLHMGDWTLKSKDKFPVEPYLKDIKKRIPGGETVEEFDDRQWAVFKIIFGLAKDFPNGGLLVGGHGSNVAFLNNRVFAKDGKIGYEGLVDPGGLIAVTSGGLIPLTKVRDKNGAKKSGLVQLEQKFKMPAVDTWAIEVPKGGSSCKTCKFLGDDEKTCTHEDFIAWEGKDKPAGSNKIPLNYDRYCSVWYLPAKGVLRGK